MTLIASYILYVNYLRNHRRYSTTYRKRGRGRQNGIDPEETLRDKTRATGGQERTVEEWQEGWQIRTRAFSGENRSSFLFMNRRCPERARSSGWIFCRSSQIDPPLNPRATRMYSGADRIFRRPRRRRREGGGGRKGRYFNCGN